jgi:hypothetical protein
MLKPILGYDAADSLEHSKAHYSLEVASLAPFPILTAAHVASLVAVQVTPLLSRISKISRTLG